MTNKKHKAKVLTIDDLRRATYGGNPINFELDLEDEKFVFYFSYTSYLNKKLYIRTSTDVAAGMNSLQGKAFEKALWMNRKYRRIKCLTL